MFDFFADLPVYYQTLIATFMTWGITILGSSLVFFFKKVNKTILDAMLALAAGVMLAASFWSLLNPAIDIAEKMGMIPWLVLFLGFFSGGLALYWGDYAFSKYLNKKSKNKEKNSGIKRSFMLFFSITLHNIPEGLCIGVAFGSLAFEQTHALLVGAIMLALGIGIQNFPEGAAVSLPLRREGYTPFKSFLIGNLSGIVEPIAGLIGCLLVLKVQNILPYFLAFSAGAMIYAVVSELIPESQTNQNKRLITLFTIIGFTIMMILDIALGG